MTTQNNRQYMTDHAYCSTIQLETYISRLIRHNSQFGNRAKIRIRKYLVLVPDRQSDHKYDKITSARSAKIAKYQLWNKAVEVVKNATGYKCEISPATDDENVVQIPIIYIALQCLSNIFITAFMKIMNLLTRAMYLPYRY